MFDGVYISVHVFILVKIKIFYSRKNKIVIVICLLRNFAKNCETVLKL